MSADVEALLQGCNTVAAKIRALATAGYPRAEIARLLGKRYQHVRNVLEEPKATTKPAVEAEALPGMAEADPSAFVHDRSQTYRLEVGKDGSVILPPEVLRVLGTHPGGVIIADLGEETFSLISAMTAIRRIQARMRKYVPEGVSLVDELIADRRRETAAEETGD